MNFRELLAQTFKEDEALRNLTFTEILDLELEVIKDKYQTEITSALDSVNLYLKSSNVINRLTELEAEVSYLKQIVVGVTSDHVFPEPICPKELKYQLKYLQQFVKPKVPLDYKEKEDEIPRVFYIVSKILADQTTLNSYEYFGPWKELSNLMRKSPLKYDLIARFSRAKRKARVLGDAPPTFISILDRDDKVEDAYKFAQEIVASYLNCCSKFKENETNP